MNSTPLNLTAPQNRFLTHLTRFLVLPLLLLLTAATLFSCKPQEHAGDLSLVPGNLKPDEIVLFFSKSRGSEVVTEGVVRKVPEPDQKDRLGYAVRELLEGPSDEESVRGFFSEIPKGTRFIGKKEAPDAIRLNFSTQFTAGGGSNSMQQRLEELRKTILAVEKQRPVFVDIQGKQLNVLGGEGIVVNEPINKGSGNEIQ